MKLVALKNMGSGVKVDPTKKPATAVGLIKKACDNF